MFVEVLIVVAVVAAGLLVLVPALLERSRRDVRSDIATAQSALYQRIDSLNQRLDGLQGSVGASLAGTADTMGRIGEQLGALSASTNRMLEVGQDIASLQDILRPPKLRGGFGETLMERLLADAVPGRYVCQHRFRSGDVVDAVIHLSSGMVPVDSKFPLDAFVRLAASESDGERRAHRRDFERALRGHIDAVARYIRADEGTLDFALMYIPAENVYYELLRDDLGAESGGTGARTGIFAYAQDRRVFLVSPSTFYSYLSAIALGLRGLRVEERAREIIGHLSRLNHEFEAFQRDFGVLGGHLEGARKKYEGLTVQVTRLGEHIARPLEHEPQDALAEAEQPTLIA
ncbi:MAG TPA: DNA recombination protein RmuC [Dehalococcoidia bacterium]